MTLEEALSMQHAIMYDDPWATIPRDVFNWGTAWSIEDNNKRWVPVVQITIITGISKPSQWLIAPIRSGRLICFRSYSSVEIWHKHPMPTPTDIAYVSHGWYLCPWCVDAPPESISAVLRDDLWKQPAVPMDRISSLQAAPDMGTTERGPL